MTEKFCCNRLCRFHVDCAAGINRLQYIYPATTGSNIDVRRLVIRDPATGAEFRFCEICANAVALVNEQSKK
jgi:hypothetical protein